MITIEIPQWFAIFMATAFTFSFCCIGMCLNCEKKLHDLQSELNQGHLDFMKEVISILERSKKNEK